MECKKAKYANEEFANEDILRIKKYSTRNSVPQRAYLCPLCNFWHLTSKRDTKDEEIVRLNKQISELQEEIILLKSPNRELKLSLLKDKSLKGLREINSTLRKKNKQLMSDNLMLINKIAVSSVKP